MSPIGRITGCAFTGATETRLRAGTDSSGSAGAVAAVAVTRATAVTTVTVAVGHAVLATPWTGERIPAAELAGAAHPGERRAAGGDVPAARRRPPPQGA